MQHAEDGVRGAASPATHHAPRTTRHSGVALVITLVLISVITFMAITFLVVSRSQHGAVVTTTDQAIARLAADSARERAIVQLLAPMMAWRNESSYGLTVSTNFINLAGFNPGALPVAFPNPTNVNYDYIMGGGVLNPAQQHQNIANLLYDPRPPVYITNRTGFSNEFRFYVDLNRNGRYDPNGLWPEINPQGGFYDTNGNYRATIVDGNTLSNYFIGDPEWIGVLQRPEFAHSATNLFTSRYAYMVVPIGQTLDLNTIHNDAKHVDLDSNPANDGFLRNQGVGTWEINLAAFLTDLNTNFWLTYNYSPYTASVNPDDNSNGGLAFGDASSLLWYRYNGNWNRLAPVSTSFPGNGAKVFTSDWYDGYSGGPVMIGTWWPVTGVDGDTPRTGLSWSGSDNPNRFYSTQDLFDRTKVRPTGAVFSFVDRLQMAGTNVDTYNRYTFSRLLSQLGTDSAPEPSGKMNLNYCNVDTNGYVVPNAATNFNSWKPEQFFTNAAVRLLADAGYAVGDPRQIILGPLYATNILVTNVVNGVLVTNLYIPIWPTNYYTPSVHRLLQLAVNLYDATTNRADLTGYPYLPTVLRPVFRQDSSLGTVAIVGYREVADADTTYLLTDYSAVRDLSETNDWGSFNGNRDMVWGIPMVIGAKKGLPNFNEYEVQTQIRVTRKLQFHRKGTSISEPVNEVDQMFVVGISNVVGVEAWNSYADTFKRNLQLVVCPDISVLLSNRVTGNLLNKPPYLSRPWRDVFVRTNISAYSWQGYVTSEEWTSFQIPFYTNALFLTNAVYHEATDTLTNLTGQFERTIGTTNFYIPQWHAAVKARLRFAILDQDAGGKILDYVNLAADNVQDLTQDLTQGGNCGATFTQNGNNGSMWCTNRMYGKPASDTTTATFGIQNQIEASLGHITPDWNSAVEEYPPGMDRTAAIEFFKNQFITGYQKASNTFNAPFQPSRSVYFVTSWQANDPLVHYTAGDLADLTQTNLVLDQFTSGSPIENLGKVNDRYEPWGRVRSSSLTPAFSSYEVRVKDPVSTVDQPVGRSDNWDFPTNKFPNVGWVGRVHRGTPWQTAYLKSYGYDAGKWQQWTGNPVWATNFGQLTATNLFPLYGGYWDSYLSQPTNDWRLLDLFTASLNDNATRGQLSINQTNLAAWSAVLSGVVVLTNYDNTGNPGLYPLVIQPAGVYKQQDATTWSPVARLVNAINRVRANTNTASFVFPNQVFRRLGDILTVPELTVASPFLNTNAPPGDVGYVLNDAAIERLPQQIAGLLKVDSVPRFAIYAFGQTLKPSLRSPFVTSGPFSGLCTNYQIMAETATRTVVRFEGVPLYQRGTPAAIANLHPVIESFNILPLD